MRPTGVQPPSTASVLSPGPSARKIRFDGSCCLNLRSITSGMDLLEGTKPTSAPLTRDELTSFLWFVETCVMSRALYFDGTVPPDQLAKALDQIGRVGKQLAVRELDIQPIRFHLSEDILFNARAALVESSLLLGHFHIDTNVDQPVTPEQHATFTRALQEIEALDKEARGERALMLVDQRFFGSKCIAALADAGAEGLAAARRAYETHPDGHLVTAALVNRFRLNYLNQLASWFR
jgi:hypothetical protein